MTCGGYGRNFRVDNGRESLLTRYAPVRLSEQRNIQFTRFGEVHG